MFVSSANKTVFAWGIFRGRSFMYRENNIGPRIEPCGTPTPVCLMAEMALPLSMYKIENCKYCTPVPEHHKECTCVIEYYKTMCTRSDCAESQVMFLCTCICANLRAATIV